MVGNFWQIVNVQRSINIRGRIKKHSMREANEAVTLFPEVHRIPPVKIITPFDIGLELRMKPVHMLTKPGRIPDRMPLELGWKGTLAESRTQRGLET